LQVHSSSPAVIGANVDDEDDEDEDEEE